MIKPTRVIAFSLILACSGLFYGQNALATIDTTKTGTADCTFPDVEPNNVGYSHTQNMADINWSFINGVATVANSATDIWTGTAGAYNQSFDARFGEPASYLYLSTDFTTGLCASGLYCVAQITGQSYGYAKCANNYLDNSTPPTPITTPALTSTSTLDLIMTSILNTVIDFTRKLYTDFWPFVLAFAIVATSAKVISKFFNLIAK